MNVVVLVNCLVICGIFSSVTGGRTTKSPQLFLPVHPELKETDKFSVPPAAGKEVSFGNFSVYTSPYNNNSTKLLVVAYDIFGFHPHVKFIADELSKSGFLVVIPDLLHGNAIPLENFPQPNFMERATRLFSKTGSWVENKQDLLKVIKSYKTKYEITGVGMFGFCWGGKLSVFAASDPDFKDLNAIALIHPSRVETNDAEGINIPALLLPSKSEPDMLPFLEILNKNMKQQKSEHHRYTNMTHGFAGARSDFSNKDIRNSVQDVIKRLSTFFDNVL